MLNLFSRLRTRRTTSNTVISRFRPKFINFEEDVNVSLLLSIVLTRFEARIRIPINH